MKKYKICNLGNNTTVGINNFIEIIEQELGKKADKIIKPMQDGDVSKTWAEMKDFEDDYNYKPNTSIEEGLKKFVSWYKKYISSK